MSKHECVGHVQKRMGTALREKAKEKFVNERGERVRMRGKGRLTDKTIKLLTRYYGNSGQVPSPNSRKGWRSLFLPSRGSTFLTRTITGCLHQ